MQYVYVSDGVIFTPGGVFIHGIKHACHHHKASSTVFLKAGARHDLTRGALQLLSRVRFSSDEVPDGTLGSSIVFLRWKINQETH